MAVDWREYQEEAAALFRSLGLSAETDPTIEGVRTTHDVDVLVKSSHVGFEITWIVECKHWNRPINKLHILSLRQIVTDVGADRGILLSESGYQSGSIEAANLTKVRLSSLEQVRESSRASIFAMRLRDLHDRVIHCKDRYWEIPKEDRIRHKLRPPVGVYGFSGTHAIEISEDLLSRAFRGQYPFQCEESAAMLFFGEFPIGESASEVAEAVEELIVEIEKRLDNYDESFGTA